LTKPTGNPKGRPPGRPKGSRDARPVLLGLLEKYRLYPVLMAEFEKAKAEMTAKEKFQFSLELAKLGIVASPKTMDLAEPMQVSLIINGVRQVNAIDRPAEMARGEEPLNPRALPAPVIDWAAGLPGKKSEKSEFLRSLEKSNPPEPPPPVAPPPGPVFQAPVFIVPNVEEEFGPPEWRDPLYPESEE